MVPAPALATANVVAPASKPAVRVSGVAAIVDGKNGAAGRPAKLLPQPEVPDT